MSGAIHVTRSDSYQITHREEFTILAIARDVAGYNATLGLMRELTGERVHRLATTGDVEAVAIALERRGYTTKEA